jgi:hypothetical protein
MTAIVVGLPFILQGCVGLVFVILLQRRTIAVQKRTIDFLQGINKMQVDVIGWQAKHIHALEEGELCFVCPRCEAVSFNTNDIRHGWCGKCNACTGMRRVP